ncbi:hypothetical protein PsYK624_145070 [Phanerochaete sordida]|uniref:Uncharacterized protein n=1 Tax=Phanerochaete sordida TaxID=48140 RepID=A0A9P3GP45_9APHY|nr:hypothetical protein PsYK624_145070 [Phanerochaete sordida]
MPARYKGARVTSPPTGPANTQWPFTAEARCANVAHAFLLPRRCHAAPAARRQYCTLRPHGSFSVLPCLEVKHDLSTGSKKV